tara:strand:+ start:82 stop:459 length:378 start_codon:yes stop_codon:yes gene_type:complete
MGDDSDTIALKFRKAKTDPDALPSEQSGLDDRPEAKNLVSIYAALGEQSVAQVLSDVGGKQFSEFKPMLAELAVEKLSGISDEMTRLMHDTYEIDRVLANGIEKAKAIAAPVLKETYEIVGILRP